MCCNHGPLVFALGQSLQLHLLSLPHCVFLASSKIEYTNVGLFLGSLFHSSGLCRYHTIDCSFIMQVDIGGGHDAASFVLISYA